MPGMVCKLRRNDLQKVMVLDEESGFNVSQWLDEDVSDIAYGIFSGRTLLGYCTLGSADCCHDLYGEDSDYDIDTSLVLNDVYVKKEFRHKGYGRWLVSRAISRAGGTVYLQAINNYVQKWYELIGFRTIKNERMKCLRGNLI